ncbi:hypothetical protein [Paenibacillus tuaregi]|uniref:hypothetical protein n=1 Tax=Paenibacillus tuaregi TaxID=1816681 RepID=UPI000837E394|nr:hypothetical protein [Paenibacillus tuaregi]
MILWLIFWGILLVAGYMVRRGKRLLLHPDTPEGPGSRMIRSLGTYCYSIGAAGLLREIIPLLFNVSSIIPMLNIILVSFVLTLTLVMFAKLRRLKLE